VERGPVKLGPVAAILVAGLLVAVFLRLMPDQDLFPRIDMENLPELDVDLAARAFELTQAREGRPLWKLWAQLGTVLQDGQRIDLEKPLLTYYQEQEGGQELTVRAPAGFVNQDTGAMQFGPRVTGQFGPMGLRALALHYDGVNQIRALGDVRLTRGSVLLEAPEAALDTDTNIFTASGGVAVIFRKQQP
jgi:hypothetical protein